MCIIVSRILPLLFTSHGMSPSHISILPVGRTPRNYILSLHMDKDQVVCPQPLALVNQVFCLSHPWMTWVVVPALGSPFGSSKGCGCPSRSGSCGSCIRMSSDIHGSRYGSPCNAHWKLHHTGLCCRLWDSSQANSQAYNTRAKMTALSVLKAMPIEDS